MHGESKVTVLTDTLPTEIDTASPHDAILEEETDTISTPNTVLQEKRNVDTMLQEEMGTASAHNTVQQEKYTIISLDGMLDKETDKCTASDKPCDASLPPDCWSMRQYDSFKQKYAGLITRAKKLGCLHCAKFDSLNMKGVHISIEWKKCQVVASGKNKTIQQASLRKKMKAHFTSKAHAICVNQVDECENDAITKSIDKANQKYSRSTCKVFDTVYSLAKRSRPFSDVEDDIELQIKNGVDMGVGLYSRKTAVKIVAHIAKDI